MPTTSELSHASTPCARLGELLPRWLARVPLYRGPGYDLSPRNVSEAPSDAFRRLPFITKRDIRHDFPNNFLPGGEAELDKLIEQDLVELEHTSGTSESRVPLLLPLGWWLEQEERALRLNPIISAVLNEFPEARRCVITSPVCNGDINYSSTPAQFDRIVGNALYLSLNRQPLMWADSDLTRMAEEAVEWQPQFLDVDPVYGVRFAQYCERHGVKLPSLRFILCSYEYVSAVHRRILQRAFGVPVIDLYGSTETGHLLMENGKGEMVPSPATACLEVVAADASGIGSLVVTTLTNDYMPLIRYRIGDLVERREQDGRARYILHGREADACRLPSGNRVTIAQLDQCFAGLAGFTHYQLMQTAEAEWQLRYMPDLTPPTAENLAELQRRLLQRFGVTRGITLQPTEFLLPEASGKFRLSYPLPSAT